MLRLSALGLASPLGGVVQACAAHRAGVVRPSAAPDMEWMASGDREPQPLQVHAVRGVTHGFRGAGRLVALLTDALGDLLARGGLPQGQGGLFLALADPQERGFTLSADVDEPDAEEPQERIDALGAALVERVDLVTGAGLAALSPAFFGGGHVAYLRALSAATEAVSRRQAAWALVGAADSLCAPEALERFLQAERVKTDQRPVGFMPGEAAAFALVAREGEGPKVRRVALTSAEGDGTAPPDGRALLAAALEALGPEPAGSAPWLVSDHDGEERRAAELGYLQHRLVTADRRLADAPVWFPAVGFGNTGAASGAVALCVATRALQRGYAPSTSALLLSQSDGVARGAVQLA